MKFLLLAVLLVGCEEHLPLKRGVDKFAHELVQMPKIVVRDILDIEEEERAADKAESESSDNEVKDDDSVEDSIKKLQKQIKELKKLNKKVSDLEKEKDDAAKDLEDIYEKLECAGDAKGLSAVKKCLEKDD